jgi:hypothetical protein
MSKYIKLVGVLFVLISFVLTGSIGQMLSNETSGSEVKDYFESENINSSLIAHWKFDETNGDVAYDSANGYHGIVNGGATWVSGQIENALLFDGIEDYVDLPQNAITDIGSLSQGTIVLWFKYSYNLDQQEISPLFYIGIDNENDPDNMFIIEIGHRNPSNTRLYVTWIKNNQVPILCFDSRFLLNENQWYHFAVVVGPEGNTGYLNGVELVNRRYNFGKPSDQIFLADIPMKEMFSIGYGKTSDVIGQHFYYYKGLIDDIRIYDQPLSASEIYDLYDNNVAPFPPSISGQLYGKVGVEYEYSFSTEDLDGDDIAEYIVNWGDDTGDETLSGPFPSGDEATASHTWDSEGVFTIKAKAKDIWGAESEWAEFPITMPRNRLLANQFILQF